MGERFGRNYLRVLNTTIGQRLLALFLSISLLPVVIMGWIAIRAGETEVHRQTFKVLRAASDGAEAQIREFLHELKSQVVDVSRDDLLRQDLEAAASGAEEQAISCKLAAQLTCRRASVPEAQELFVLSPEGRVLASSGPEHPPGRDLSSTEYFSRGRQGFYPGDVIRDSESGAVTWIMSAPLHERANGRLLGILACNVDPRQLSALTTGRRVRAEGADTQCFQIGETGETYIVNREKYMITESRFWSNTILRVKVNTPPVRRALNDGTEFAGDYADYRGVRVTGTSMLLPDLGWIALTEIDFNQAFLPLQHLRNGLLVTTLALGLLVSLLAWDSARRILRPIDRLNECDRALAVGDEARAIVPEPGLPRDEIGEFIRRRNHRVKALFSHQRELLQEQKRRADVVAELEQLSYSIIHDLRAPLRALVGFSSMIETESGAVLPPESRDHLGRIRTAALRMDRLICDVLNYSRIVREDLPLHPVNLNELLHGIIDTYPAFQAQQAEISLAGDMPPVQGNEAALTQCFSNLLVNAVKFVPPGRVPQIRIEAETRQDWVRISIQDNGVGVRQELQERIFGIFQRANTNGEGTGMGLAIVRKAAERMGGRVGLDSRPGVGSCFWLELRAASRN